MNRKVVAVMPKLLPPIVEVLWKDTFTRTGWTEHRTVETGRADCRTVGYLLKRDKNEVQVFSSWNSDERGDTTVIDMRIVKSIRFLRK
jgi:hypothetical protein